jgi:hypothetical protein
MSKENLNHWELNSKRELYAFLEKCGSTDPSPNIHRCYFEDDFKNVSYNNNYSNFNALKFCLSYSRNRTHPK